MRILPNDELPPFPDGPFVIHGEAPGILHHIWVEGATVCPICGAEDDTQKELEPPG